jgi:hypothetical protein
MLTLPRTANIILVRELYTSTKLITKNKDLNLELFGVRYAKLMVTKELLLLDFHQIFLLELWEPLLEYNYILKEIEKILYFIIFIILFNEKET